ncbi:protein mono-ADP-ribosyltransferase PARP14-like [Clinocottus analis]|uniref:protein mono-ADP-ribosyltransferase PARP14-like n=1 Tax=Clinocottus analis TaxID=304258 RepID=UPI0035C10D03
MDEYQHPLFFQAEHLTDKDKQKIVRYFQKKRDSGGGVCGGIENAEGNVYKISFKDKEDQERVLQRKCHTVSLPSGDVRLTVSRAILPQTPDQPSCSHSQTVTRANTKSLEKIFKLEIFLLFFLRDNPKARKVLQNQLSSIGCTLELDFDEEEAVVTGDIEKGPGGAFGAAEKWEKRVDLLFIDLTESYLCYHVIEPHQAATIQQDLSFATDDVKVYKDSGYVVVVGPVETVKEKISSLEKRMPARKELPIGENQFKLVEEEFSREMRAHHPEVKILKGPASLTLEGPAKDVQPGAAKLDELMTKVEKKRVALCPDLMNFITLSDVIAKYEARFLRSLRSPVSLEAASELILSSLSSEALDEAEAAVRRELAVDHVSLRGDDAAAAAAAAVPPDLNAVKEILRAAENQENSREVRVDVGFIQGPGGAAGTADVLRLVGYRENVNNLKRALRDYQTDHAETQETLRLPHPELLDCFDAFLKLVNLKQTDVTLRTAPYPCPCVHVSGPRRLVQDTRKALISVLSCLTADTLALDGPGAGRYFKAEGRVSKELVESSCRVLIGERQSAPSSPIVETQPLSVRSLSVDASSLPTVGSPRYSLQRSHSSSTVGSVAGNSTGVEVKLGSLEDEQVNVLVVPMINRELASTKIGECLLSKAGDAIVTSFNSAAASGPLVPGDVMQVAAPPPLGCSKLFFVQCSRWDGVKGRSRKLLGHMLKRCLDLCAQQGMTSVAFPVIGPGIALKYPLEEAVKVLTRSILKFGLTASSGSLSSIRIVIKPDYPDSEECYDEVYRNLSANMNHGGQAIFKSLTGDLDDITLTVGGGVKLQLVVGNIVSETTDVVVNTTDFIHFGDDGVCKAILAKAGPAVEADLRAAKRIRGEVFVSQPGSFPCSAIFHVCGEKDVALMEHLVRSIVDRCEAYKFKSVAIPAMCAGVTGLPPGVVAGAILRGVLTATSSASLSHLRDIRIVLNRMNVFLAFKEELTTTFPAAVNNRVPALRSPLARAQQLPMSEAADLSVLCSSSASQQSVFWLLGLIREDVDDAATKLRDLYRAQCAARTFSREELAGLTRDDVEDLKRLVEAEGLYVSRERSGGAATTVSGLKDGVNRVTQRINDSFRREVRVREEEDLFARVSWCILGRDGLWERLPKTANHKLENNDVAGGIVDAESTTWSVDHQRISATSLTTLHGAMLKRLEHLSDFTFPLQWDNMAAGEAFRKVALSPHSGEYKLLEKAFKETAQQTVMKIERVQNVHLRRAYQAQRNQISDKNRQPDGECERSLWHGTTQDSCDSIMKNGFDRRFSGQNGTRFGEGTYFARDAQYSAQPTYSKPAADGSQLMFVALVLIGVYAQGQANMRVPPTRSYQQSHDRYDSVVDNISDPTMFVVFHDNQAYPDYLITFK